MKSLPATLSDPGVGPLAARRAADTVSQVTAAGSSQEEPEADGISQGPARVSPDQQEAANKSTSQFKIEISLQAPTIA